jgi:hypothetical protein
MVKCGIRKQYVIKDPNSDEAIVAVRSAANSTLPTASSSTPSKKQGRLVML